MVCGSGNDDSWIVYKVDTRVCKEVDRAIFGRDRLVEDTRLAGMWPVKE